MLIELDPVRQTYTLSIASQTVDEIFAKVLGLLALFTLFVGILSFGYKSWRVRVELARTLNRKNKAFLVEGSLMDYLKEVIGKLKPGNSYKMTK